MGINPERIAEMLTREYAAMLLWFPADGSAKPWRRGKIGLRVRGQPLMRHVAVYRKLRLTSQFVAPDKTSNLYAWCTMRRLTDLGIEVRQAVVDRFAKEKESKQ